MVGVQLINTYAEYVSPWAWFHGKFYDYVAYPGSITNDEDHVCCSRTATEISVQKDHRVSVST